MNLNWYMVIGGKVVKDFSTMGSCSSRNIFNSELNKDYKKFFRINRSIETVNIISLMSKPIEYDESQLDSGHKYDNVCVHEDLSKSFLDFIKGCNIDYLIIDTYFDVTSPVFVIDEDTFVTDSTRIKKVSYYSSVKDYKRLSVTNSSEYLNLCKDAYDSFFKFLEETNPKINVILNCSRSVFKYRDDDGNIAKSEKLKDKAKFDKYRDVLDLHILENYDVDVLPFDGHTLGDKNHIYGLHESHYEPKYYEEKTKQLNEIIQRQDSFDDEMNSKFRKLLREKAIHGINDNLYMEVVTDIRLKKLKFINAL